MADRTQLFALILFFAFGISHPAFSQIVDEQPNGIAERMFLQYGVDPRATLNSYAVAKVVSRSTSPWPGTSCTGTMIGPNVMISAAHCHGDRKTATFRAYVSATQQMTEDFTCDYLLHTYPENDLAIHWCFANSQGQNPGDKWGYVDFELDISGDGTIDHNRSRDPVRVGQNVYSIWWNPINTIGGDHSIFSKGQMTDTNAVLWANPGGNNCSKDDDDDIGVHTNAWGAGGASGSLQFWKTTGRAILAPLSLASGDANGGPSRTASTIVDLLNFAQTWDTRVENPLIPAGCAGRIEPFINLRALQTLWDQGIQFDPAFSSFPQYLGLLDKNRNGVFDIQEDLEAAAGEGPSDFFYLNFNSNRLNVQQQLGASSTIDWFAFLGFLKFSDIRDVSGGDAQLSTPQLLIDYRALNLDPAQSYRVLVNSRGETDFDDDLQICMGSCADKPLGNSNSDTAVATFPTGDKLEINRRSIASGLLWDIAISTPSTVFDFDTAAKRSIWSNRSGSNARQSPADIRPLGRLSNVQVDWAGVVRNARASQTAGFSLATHLIPIPVGSAKICFDVKIMPGGASSGKGVLRFVGTTTHNTEFDVVASDWRRVCTPRRNVGEAGSKLMFGATAGTAFDYAVDNISVQWLPITLNELPDNSGATLSP